MNSQEFWDEHIITHKLVYHHKDGKREAIGVGSINMCNRYVEQHPKLKITIEEL